MLGRRTFEFEHTIQVTAAPTQVIAAFFDPEALATWWQTVRSVTTPRPLGVYAVEWEETPFQDEVLGSLGGVFYGTVMEFRNGREFLVADAHWLPPESDAIGPMALEVSCKVTGPATDLLVRQSSAEGGERWTPDTTSWSRPDGTTRWLPSNGIWSKVPSPDFRHADSSRSNAPTDRHHRWRCHRLEYRLPPPPT